jgi:broad specificity phosphatase PhoE
MQPDFAPPSGESLNAVIERVRSAIDDLPGTSNCLIVSHGGPIAIARAITGRTSLDQLASLIPQPGEIVELALPARPEPTA